MDVQVLWRNVLQFTAAQPAATTVESKRNGRRRAPFPIRRSGNIRQAFWHRYIVFVDSCFFDKVFIH